MLLPTHNEPWRKRWSALTEAVETLLSGEAPDLDQLMELLRDRQKHLVAFQNVQPDDSTTSLNDQRAWAESMLERDHRLRERISELMSANSRTLASYKTNKRALKRLRLEKITPQRHYILNGHL